MDIEIFLKQALQQRKEKDLLRTLKQNSSSKKTVDFFSNDYLGVSQNKNLEVLARQIYAEFYPKTIQNGSTGSRLLSGNFPLVEAVEKKAAEFHKAQSALFYNSGYDANIGLISSLANRNDIVIYDKLIHASIRDGITLSRAKNFSFAHNDMQDVEKKLLFAHKKNERSKKKAKIFVISESVFSMDGDSPNLKQLVAICEKYNAALIVDEAHAGGIFCEGKGFVCQEGLQEKVFAQVVTFGKAAGLHGAVVLGKNILKEYLINFSRSFIFTTAHSPRHLAYVMAYYVWLDSQQAQQKREKLFTRIDYFKQLRKQSIHTDSVFWLTSESSIQSLVVKGNTQAKALSHFLFQKNFQVLPVLSPTVPAGKERLRICLHSYNTKSEVEKFFEAVKEFFG